MYKRIFWIFVCVIVVCISLAKLGKMADKAGKGLAKIMLHEDFHHNNIGELPFVEVWDDGNFYEVDGQEDVERDKKAATLRFLEREANICFERADIECDKLENDEEFLFCYEDKAAYCSNDYETEVKKLAKVYHPWTSFFMPYYSTRHENLRGYILTFTSYKIED